MENTDEPSGDDPMAKHKHVNTHKTISQLEEDHGEKKSPEALADEAFQKDDETEFKTPEEVAQSEDIQEETDTPMKKKQGFFARLNHKNLTKKQKIILIALFVVLLLGLLVGAWMWKNKKTPSSIMTAVQKEEPPKTSEPSKLTGREVALDVNKRQVTSVMIENSPDARPQSGLKDAGIVFEAIAEGGVSRFVALYQDTEPDYIGPVRSARPYYVEWILGFDAAYAHVGGSPDALALIKSQGVKDLDQFANPGSYERIKSRYAPHNVYTSSAKLNDLEKAKGFDTSNFSGFVRKKDAPSATPTHKQINVTLSGFLYNPHWDYDQATNTYLRSQAGKPHTDEKSGQQLRANVVVVMVMKKGVMSDGHHTTYETSGSGKAYFFQDGGSYEGTWTKKDAKSQITFTDSAGNPMGMNPGMTWVTAVGGPENVSAGP